MRPAAKKEAGQTSPQPAPKEAVIPPLSGLHHSLSTSDTIKSDKGAQDGQQLAQSSSAREVHDLNFDRQPHAIARKQHRRSTSMPGGVVRELMHYKAENSAVIAEEIEGSPPTSVPVSLRSLPSSEPLAVPRLVLELPAEGANNNGGVVPSSANTLTTVGSALGTSVLSQNSPSTEPGTPQLALSTSSVAKPVDEKGPVGKRLLDTISNIFAADKKTL